MSSKKYKNGNLCFVYDSDNKTLKVAALASLISLGKRLLISDSISENSKGREFPFKIRFFEFFW